MVMVTFPLLQKRRKLSVTFSESLSYFNLNQVSLSKLMTIKSSDNGKCFEMYASESAPGPREIPIWGRYLFLHL